MSVDQLFLNGKRFLKRLVGRVQITGARLRHTEIVVTNRQVAAVNRDQRGDSHQPALNSRCIDQATLRLGPLRESREYRSEVAVGQGQVGLIIALLRIVANKTQLQRERLIEPLASRVRLRIDKQSAEVVVARGQALEIGFVFGRCAQKRLLNLDGSAKVLGRATCVARLAQEQAKVAIGRGQTGSILIARWRRSDQLLLNR